MNVFLSWSGEESKAVAQALYFWLPEVIQSVRPWMSQQDLVAGTRWSNEIQGNLKQSAFGIICVTPSNRVAPWLNFEAGAISNNLGVVNVVPYIFRLGFADLTGPLSQFQGKEATEEGTKDVIGALNKSLGEAGLDSRRLENAFNKLWPDLKARLEAIPQTPEAKASQEEAQGRSGQDKLDEMLLLLRRVVSSPTDKLVNRLEAQKSLKARNSEILRRSNEDALALIRIRASFLDGTSEQKFIDNVFNLGTPISLKEMIEGEERYLDLVVPKEIEDTVVSLASSNKGFKTIRYIETI